MFVQAVMPKVSAIAAIIASNAFFFIFFSSFLRRSVCLIHF
jgi:hypothetical protein